MTTMPQMPPPPGAADRPSAWPTVLGIIAIVLGAIAAFGGCFGIIASSIIPPLMERLQGAVPPPTAGGPSTSLQGVQGMVAYAPWLISFQVVYLLVSLLLLAGGAMLLRRRPAARPICLWWAVLKILYALPYAVLNYRVNLTNMRQMQEDPNLTGLFAGRFFDAMVVAGVAMQTVWYCALPVFMFIWFSRRRVREEMATWGEAGPVIAPPDGTPLS